MNFNDFLTSIETHWFGITLLVVLILFFLRSFCKIYGFGRFKKDITNWISRLFDDFRHVLAFLIIMFFFVIVLYALIKDGKCCDSKMEATKTILASLGGLIGSIIGYYFGESKGSRRDNTNNGGQGDIIPPAPDLPPPNDTIIVPEEAENDNLNMIG